MCRPKKATIGKNFDFRLYYRNKNNFAKRRFFYLPYFHFVTIKKDENREAVQVFEELLVTEGRYVQRLKALQEIRERINQRVEHLKTDIREQVHQALDPPGLEAIIQLHK